MAALRPPGWGARSSAGPCRRLALPNHLDDADAVPHDLESYDSDHDLGERLRRLSLCVGHEALTAFSPTFTRAASAPPRLSSNSPTRRALSGLNVELGSKILAGAPNAAYSHYDAKDFSTLDAALTERVLGPKRRLGMVVGCAVFIPDDKLRALYAALYDWAPAGSFLAFDFDSRELGNYPAALAMLGDGFFMRTPGDFAPLLGPWQITEDGIAPVAAWRSEGPPVEIPTFMYGGVVRK